MDTGLLMLGSGIVAGVFGSLLGLGGGILIVPLLSVGFGLPVREAVGVSLICVIMTSGASAAVFLERDVANLRLGMLLELFTAAGAVIGGAIAFLIDERYVAGMLAILMVYVAWTMLRAATRAGSPATPAAAAAPASVDDPSADSPGDAVTGASAQPAFIDRLSRPGYRIRNLRFATVGAVFAGVLSALLGIGGGIIKVPIMNLAMGVPLRVATATSNLMIGITASTSAIVYLLRGGIDPYAAGPTAVGVFIGATIGSRTVHRIDLRILRWLFVAVLIWTAYEMTRKALGLA